MASEAKRSLILAAGGLLWRHSSRHGLRLAVIHRPRYDDWTLPKGKCSTKGDQESLQQTAVREIAEETGFACRLGRVLGIADYLVPGAGKGSQDPIAKQVTYFAAEAQGGAFVPNDEVDSLDWLTADHAADRLTYDDERLVLSSFLALPPDLTTVVLVRHARAGKRESFDGDDLGRPLDDKGRAQAKALRDILISYRPEHLVSAPAVRCQQTIRPTAKALDLAVTIDDTIGEDNYQDDPGAARRTIVGLATGHQHSVVLVSSQGGVIPGVVRSLSAKADLEVPDVSTPKAAHWVLSFNGATLVQSDPHPAPAVTVH